MTISMIITLAIVVLMIAVIISDKLPFGAPALIACALLVVCKQVDIATAFSGFTDKNVIMIMGFMVCTAALQKTAVIHKLKGVLGGIASKGGVGGFIAIIFACMLVGNFVTGTAFYVLIITIMATIPYNKKLPASQVLLPAAMAPAGWLPNGAVMMIGIIVSLVSSAGIEADMSVAKYCLMNVVWSAFYLIYSTVMHRVLPNHDISDASAEEKEKEEETFVPTLTKFQQNAVYVLYLIMLVSMMFLQQLGEVGYALPLLIAGLLLAVGAISFKEMLGNMFSPVMIMMASVIGVAEAMSATGLSTYLANLIAGLFGSAPSYFLLLMVFGLMTSLMATFTGASFGSLFVFAPIGIALCTQFGFNPVPLALVCTRAAWTNYIMPIDGMPALAMGTGKYKLTQFWAYTVPLYILQLLFVSAAALLLFN